MHPDQVECLARPEGLDVERLVAVWRRVAILVRAEHDRLFDIARVQSGRRRGSQLDLVAERNPLGDLPAAVQSRLHLARSQGALLGVLRCSDLELL